jgi:outer membrane protein TolC
MTNRKKIFLIPLVFLFAAFAQESAEKSSGNSTENSDGNSVQLSLEDAVKSAVENNVSIKREKINLDTSRRNSTYSWNSVSPTISANGSYSAPLPDKDDKGSTISAGVSLNVSISPSVYTTVKNASIAYQLQQISYDDAVRTVELNVQKSYYNILYQAEQIKLKEKSLATTKNQYESNLAKYNRGTLSRLDVLSAQVSYENARLELESLKTSLENDLSLFKQTIGIPQETEIFLTGTFDAVLNLKNFSADDVEQNSSEIQSLEKQIESAKNSLLATRFSAWGPTISAGYSYDYTSTDSGKNWNDGGTLSLRASIPLDGFLPWSSGAVSIKSKSDAIENLELQLEDKKISVQVETSNLLKKINHYIENLKVRKSSIDLAQTTYDMAYEAYNHGTKDLLSLQTSADNLVESRVNQISEAYSLICAILDLENTLNVPFGTLLNSSDSAEPENSEK